MIIVLMGVSGSGKTTIGERLAADLGWSFYDADDFHPPENIAKMARGQPLTDADRDPWLVALRDKIAAVLARRESAVVACSALKETYRRMLRVDAEAVQFVYLKGHYELILARMQSRDDHYMKPEMLRSQFKALEVPHDALTVSIDQPPDAIVAEIKQTLGLG